MVRDIMGLLEIFSILFTLSETYNVKFSFGGCETVYTIAQLVILSGINNHGFPAALIYLSYILMFLYCLLNYKSTVKQAIVNCVITSVAVGIMQMLCYFVVSYFFQNFVWKNSEKELLISVLYFIGTILFTRKIKLKQLSEFFVKRNWLLGIVGIFVLLLLGSQVLQIKTVHVLNGQIIVPAVYFIILLIVLVYEWQKSIIDAEKRKAQLEMNQIYYEAYEGLIQSIREKQHDFMNHLNAIEGMMYSITEYDDLINTQKQYLEKVSIDTNKTKWITMIENPLIAGFLIYKVTQAKEKGIDIKHDCAFAHRTTSIPEFQLIEMMGILLDNAIEAVEEQNIKKIVSITLYVKEEKIYFMVANPCGKETISNVPKLLQEGYSSKGQYRGIGLPKLRRLVAENNGELFVSNEKIYDVDMIQFGISVNV